MEESTQLFLYMKINTTNILFFGKRKLRNQQHLLLTPPPEVCVSTLHRIQISEHTSNIYSKYTQKSSQIGPGGLLEVLEPSWLQDGPKSQKEVQK